MRLRLLAHVAASTCALALPSTVVPSVARADEGNPWMVRHVYLDDLAGVDSATGVTTWMGGHVTPSADDSRLDIAPSVDVALGRYFTLGALADLHWDHRTQTKIVADPVSGTASFSSETKSNSGILVTPRVGWRFELSDRFALWPRVGMGFGELHHHEVGSTVSSWSPVFGFDTIDGSIDLVVQVAGPLYATIGPEVRYSDFRVFGDEPSTNAVFISTRASMGLAF